MKAGLFIKRTPILFMMVLLSYYSPIHSQEYRRNIVQFNYNAGTFMGNINTYYTMGIGMHYVYRLKPRLGVEFSYNYHRGLIMDYEDNISKNSLFLIGFKMTTKATKRIQGYFTPTFGLTKGKDVDETGYYNTNTGYYIYQYKEDPFTSLAFGGRLGVDMHILPGFVFNLGLNFQNGFNMRANTYLNSGFAFKF